MQFRRATLFCDSSYYRLLHIFHLAKNSQCNPVQLEKLLLSSSVHLLCSPLLLKMFPRFSENFCSSGTFICNWKSLQSCTNLSFLKLMGIDWHDKGNIRPNFRFTPKKLSLFELKNLPSSLAEVLLSYQPQIETNTIEIVYKPKTLSSFHLVII